MSNNNPSRKFLAFFAVYCVTLVMIFVGAACFLPLPATGQKYADIAVPLLLSGVLVAIVVYFFHRPGDDAPTYPQPTKVTTEVKP